MSKMNVVNSPRFMNFSKGEQDVIEAGVNLYKHYMFRNKKDQRYAEFAQGKSYEEKNKLYSENLMKEAAKRVGMPYSNDPVIYRLQHVQQMAFSLVTETLSVIIPSTVIDNFGQFAEVKNGNWGDNFKFTIPNPNLFVVSKLADGIRRGDPQRLYSTELTLTPVNHDITIQEDFYRVVSGQVDLGEWITKIGQSVETQISTDVYNAFYSSYTGLITNFKEAAFDAAAFVKLGQRVSAANKGAKVGVFGTRIALSKIVPNANFSNFGVGVGEEYIRMGFIGNFMGFDNYMLDQRIIPNDPNYNFSIADDSLFFVAMGSDRPVKIGFEGTPIIFQTSLGVNSDNTLDYSYQQKWDTALITSQKYGIMRV